MIETPRLILRKWRDADRPAFAAINADAEIMRYFPAVMSREESDAYIDRANLKIEEDGCGFFAVERKADGGLIGVAGLAVLRPEYPFEPGYEVGWRFDKTVWSQGYASEAARASLKLGFERFNPKEILAFTVPNNLKSRAVMTRIGMSHDEEGDFDHPNLPEGHALRRHVVYRITREEWLASAPSA